MQFIFILFWRKRERGGEESDRESRTLLNERRLPYSPIRLPLKLVTEKKFGTTKFTTELFHSCLSLVMEIRYEKRNCLTLNKLLLRKKCRLELFKFYCRERNHFYRTLNIDHTVVAIRKIQFMNG